MTTFSGGAGNDTFAAPAFDTSGNDTLSGAGGDDSLDGGAGNDSLDGGSENDTLDGGDGNDSIYGGAGDDVLIQVGGQFGNSSVYDGGADVDTLRAIGVANGQLGANGQPIYFAGVAGSTVTSIERLEFASTIGQNLVFQIDRGQIGAGKIDPNAVVVGGAGVDILRVSVFGPNTYTLPALTLSNWTTTSDPATSDLVVLAVDNPTSGVSYTLNAAWVHDGIQVLVGNNGNDLLLGGESQEVLSGGAGNDTLNADWGDDTMTGGAGADVFMIGAGQDVITDFTPGVDKFDLSDYGFDSFTSLQPYLSGGANTVLTFTYNGAVNTTTFRGVASGTLGAGDFTFAANPVDHSGEDFGTPNADLLPGTGGNDSLDGAGGNDTIIGFGGNDSLIGGAGADNLNGGAGNDSLDGGSENDTLDGGDGNDSIYGGAGNDVLIQVGGQAGPAVYDGGADIDTLRAVGIVTGQVGANGNPTYFAGVGGFTVTSIERLEFASTIGQNLVFEIAHGQIGAGKIDPNAVVVGGAGVDILRVVIPFGAPPGPYNLPALTLSNWTTTSDPATSDLVILVVGNTASGVTYTLNSAWVHDGIQVLVGNNGDDLLLGGESQEVLSGGAGNDTLNADWGDDTMTGDGTSGGAVGADVFQIGLGQDVITDFVHGTDKFDLSEYGFDAFTSLQPYMSASGADTVLSFTYNGVVNTTTFKGVAFGTLTAGDFTFAGSPVDHSGEEFGTPNADLLPGTGGNDSLDGAGGNDTIIGFGGNDTLVGSAGGDSLSGGDGADNLNGGAGADTLAGDAGNDTLIGGGPDLVQGGAGSDTLVVVGDGNAGATLDGGADNDALVAINVLSGAPVGAFAGVTFNGGGGTDTLVIGGTVDFHGNMQSIENLSLLSASAAQNRGAAVLITGSGLLDLGSTPNISGEGLIRYTIAADDNDFDASGVTFVNGVNVKFEVHGSSAADTIVGSSHGDDIYGGAGNDRITAGTADIVELGDGSDTLVIDPALTVGTWLTVTDFQAGSGGDALSFAAFLSARTNWTAGTDPFASGHLRLVQDGDDARLEVDANGGGDSFSLLVGVQNTNVLALTAANLGGWAPTVSGSSGGDALDFTPTTTVAAGDAPPSLDGGAGVDTLTISTESFTPEQIVGPATITPSADGTSLLFDLNGDGITDLVVTNIEDVVLNGQNVVISGNLANTGLAPNTIHYEGTADNDVFDAGGLISLESIRANGYGGADKIIGANDDDTLQGGDGSDTLSGRGGPDSLNGGAGADSLSGGDDNDTLAGGADGDFLVGGSGKDFLYGGDGADTLSGGNGADTLTGGDGADSFRIDNGTADRIMDFTNGDHIVFMGGSGTPTWSVVDADGDGQKDDLLVSLKGGFSVEVIGVSTLHTGDWVFG